VQLKRARVQAHIKRFAPALGAITRALKALEGLDHPDAAARRADLMAWYGHFRLEQGRHADAIVWSHRAIEEADRAGAKDVLGHAYRLLDWAHVDRGEPELATYSARALELFEELGDLPNLATVRNNLGGIAYWLGNWDEALEHYAAANELDERTGDVVAAALGRNNVAEILADQGRWEEAEELFRGAERVVRAARFRGAIAYVRSNLGRTLGRLGRTDEALQLLVEARDGADEVGSNTQVIEAEARIAELHLYDGRPDDALASVESALRRADGSDGIAAQQPLLHRIRGLALLQVGRLKEADESLASSLDAARARDAIYEQALTERALADLAALRAGVPDEALETSSGDTLRRLGVVRLPELPQPSADVTA
jgi:tetratricopeptide (TPR) repeat protein